MNYHRVLYALLLVAGLFSCEVDQLELDNQPAGIPEANYLISGKVVSAADTMPIPGARILVNDVFIGTVNSDGSFELSFEDLDIPSLNTLTVVAMHPSFTTGSVILTNGNQSFGQLAFYEANFHLSPRIVSGRFGINGSLNLSSEATATIPNSLAHVPFSRFFLNQLDRKSVTGKFSDADIFDQPGESYEAGYSTYLPIGQFEFFISNSAQGTDRLLDKNPARQVTIQYTPDYVFQEGDQLAIFILDPETKSWVKRSTIAAAPTIEIKLSEWNIYMVALEDGFTISSRIVPVINPLLDTLVENCNCSPSTPLTFNLNYNLEDLIQGGIDYPIYQSLGYGAPLLDEVNLEDGTNFDVEVDLDGEAESILIDFTLEKCAGDYQLSFDQYEENITGSFRQKDGTTASFSLFKALGVNLDAEVFACQPGTDCHQGICPE